MAAAGDAAGGPDVRTESLRSVHTRSLPELLQRAASSLLISTYQAGKLVIAREDQGRLNTHFRVYDRPMGVAADSARLALGTAMSVETFYNMPDVACKLKPAGRPLPGCAAIRQPGSRRQLCPAAAGIERGDPIRARTPVAVGLS